MSLGDATWDECTRAHGGCCKRRGWTVALALLVYTAAAHAAVHLDLAQARQLQLTGHDAQAVRAYTRILAHSPGLASAWVGRGQSELALGRSEAARADFAHWIKLDPGNPYAAIWVEIAALRSDPHGAAPQPPTARDRRNWPQPIVRYLAGQIDWETMFDAALAAPEHDRGPRVCEAALFYGEKLLAAGKMKKALSGFALVGRSRCPARRALRALARSEYERLYRAGYREPPVE
jgi:lipoprotein NlpI